MKECIQTLSDLCLCGLEINSFATSAVVLVVNHLEQSSNYQMAHFSSHYSGLMKVYCFLVNQQVKCLDQLCLSLFVFLFLSPVTVGISLLVLSTKVLLILHEVSYFVLLLLTFDVPLLHEFFPVLEQFPQPFSSTNLSKLRD